MPPPQAAQAQPPPRQLPDRRQQQQQQRQQQQGECPELRQSPPPQSLSPPQQWWEQAEEPMLPCLQADPSWLPQATATPPAAPGMHLQRDDSSGSGRLTLTPPSQATLSLPPQNRGISWAEPLERAASLGSLFSPGSWPPLDGGSLILAAVPAEEVPPHQAHLAFCHPLPAPEPLQQQQQQQQWAAPMQAASQWSCAGHQPLPGGVSGEEEACNRTPPYQPACDGSLDPCMLGVTRGYGEEQMPDVLDLAQELGLLPRSEPTSPAASPPSWVPALASRASPPPAHQQHGGGERPSQPENDLLALFSDFDLPLVDPAPQQGGSAAAGPAEAAAALLEPHQAAQMPRTLQPALPLLVPAGTVSAHMWAQQELSATAAPEAAPPVLLTPACVQPPQQRQQHGTAKRQAGNLGPRQQQQQQLKHKLVRRSSGQRQPPTAGRCRQPSRRGCAAAHATLHRPCTRSAARAASIPGGAGVAPTARQPQLQLQVKAAQAAAAALLAALRSRAAAQQAEEAAARHQRQRRMLEEVQAEQQRRLEMAQQAQLLQLEQAPLAWQPKRAAQWPPAGLLAAHQPQPAAAAQQLLPVDGQPLLPQLPPLQRMISAPVQRLARPQLPPLQRTHSAPLQRGAAAHLEPSMLQRTLSLRLQQQEERLAQQRAEQQQWADAAALLLRRGGRQ